jgi:hypothetical protein
LFSQLVPTTISHDSSRSRIGFATAGDMGVTGGTGSSGLGGSAGGFAGA